MAETNNERLAKHARHQRDFHADRAAKIIPEGRIPNDAESAEIERALGERDKWEARYQGFKSPKVEVVREPLTYERNGRQSYFRDRVLSLRGDDEARARLERHAREMRVELPKLERRRAENVEYRVNPNRVQGYGGYFAPPLWLIEYFATGARANRVLAHFTPNFHLPPGVQSVNVPRIVSGTRAEDQVDDYPVEDKDITDAAVESPAMTISGMSDVSVQLLEQSPQGAHLDWAILKDLRESYDLHLEERMFNGEGTLQEFAGLLFQKTGSKLASATEITGSPKGYEVFEKLGTVAGKMGDQRKMPPEMWLMRTARWAWLGSSTDEEKLPLAVPGHQPPPEIPYLLDDSKPSAVTAILGWPLYCNDAITATMGKEANQDAIFAVRPTDWMLFESDEHTSVMMEPLSGTLQARIQLTRYAAFVVRYPSGVSYLYGEGLKVPSGF